MAQLFRQTKPGLLVAGSWCCISGNGVLAFNNAAAAFGWNWLRGGCWRHGQILTDEDVTWRDALASLYSTYLYFSIAGGIFRRRMTEYSCNQRHDGMKVGRYILVKKRFPASNF